MPTESFSEPRMSAETAISWQIYNELTTHQAASQAESLAPDLPFTEFVGIPRGGSDRHRTAYSLGIDGTSYYMQKLDQGSDSVTRLVVEADSMAQLVQYGSADQELFRRTPTLDELKLHLNELALGRRLASGEIAEEGRVYKAGSILYLGHRALKWMQQRSWLHNEEQHS